MKTPKMKAKKSVRELLLSGKVLTYKNFTGKAPKHLYKRIYDMKAKGFKIIVSEKAGVNTYKLDVNKTPKRLLK